MLELNTTTTAKATPCTREHHPRVSRITDSEIGVSCRNAAHPQGHVTRFERRAGCAKRGKTATGKRNSKPSTRDGSRGLRGRLSRSRAASRCVNSAGACARRESAAWRSERFTPRTINAPARRGLV